MCACRDTADRNSRHRLRRSWSQTETWSAAGRLRTMMRPRGARMSPHPQGSGADSRPGDDDAKVRRWRGSEDVSNVRAGAGGGGAWRRMIRRASDGSDRLSQEAGMTRQSVRRIVDRSGAAAGGRGGGERRAAEGPLQEAGRQLRVGRQRHRPQPVHPRRQGPVQEGRRRLPLGRQRRRRRSVPARVRPLEEGRRRVHVERQRLRPRSVQSRARPGSNSCNHSGVVR